MGDLKNVSKEILVEHINNIIEAAIFHGGDPGGPYGSERDELVLRMKMLRQWLSLDEYRIAEEQGGVVLKFVKIINEDKAE